MGAAQEQPGFCNDGAAPGLFKDASGLGEPLWLPCRPLKAAFWQPSPVLDSTAQGWLHLQLAALSCAVGPIVRPHEQRAALSW